MLSLTKSHTASKIGAKVDILQKSIKSRVYERQLGNQAWTDIISTRLRERICANVHSRFKKVCYVHSKDLWKYQDGSADILHHHMRCSFTGWKKKTLRKLSHKHRLSKKPLTEFCIPFLFGVL